MRFAIMWANHRPFSDHTREQLLTVTDYWIDRYFRRPNYLRMDGKLYVSFFAPRELVNGLGSAVAVRRAFDAMRERVRKAGLPGLHIAACASHDTSTFSSLRAAGFDSVTAYNYLRTGASTRQAPYRQFVLGHESIWRRAREATPPGIDYLPLLTVGWDSRPWHGPRAERKFARRPVYFAEALERLKATLDAAGDRTALLEAWNEWGEGSYIEPNAAFGFADLEAVRRVFAEPGPWPHNRAPADFGRHGAYDLRRR